jgi:hypothetical protein
MTTPLAAALYAAQHNFQWGEKPLAIHNPQNRPVHELPVIYGFNNGGSTGWLDAIAMAEDGTVLGSHTCSDECYMPHDLGCIEGARKDRHVQAYQPHYKDGYRMAFVKYADIAGCAGLQDALAKYHAKDKEQPTASPVDASKSQV